MTINQQDFITPITGNVVIQNNGARLVLQANADLNTLFEGDESFKLVLRKGSNTGPVVATTAVIIVRDTSNTITYNSLVESAGTIGEGDTVTFVLNTTNLGPNNTVYYTTTGNATSSLFVAGNTGSFITTGNAYTLSLATAATIPDNQTKFFQLQIREGSLSGPVKITSNVVTVVDALQVFVIATGGFLTIEDGYKTHHFTSSNTFSVSGLGLLNNRTLEYLIVAGGGGGGSAGGFGIMGAGGGAGGFLTGNTTLASAENYVVTVGGGGSTEPGGRGITGNSSSIFSITSLGGGGGGGFSPSVGPISPTSRLGHTGGSGGGTSGGNPTVGGSGTPGQGFSGGNATGDRHGGGGGGATSGGIPAVSFSPAESQGNGGRGGNGVSVIWVSPNFGTSGPTSGRWFAEGGAGASVGSIGVPTMPQSLPTAGGGGRGDGTWGTSTSGTVNTGGGGGAGSGTRLGGSGIVAVRYPYTVKTFNITDNLSEPRNILQNSNITYTLRTVNVSNNSVLYYTTSGNVTTSDFVGGNTGSVTVVAANAAFSISIANNIVSGGATKAFALQLREGSTSGPVIASANTVTVYSQDSSNFITATGGTIIDSDGYRLHVFTSSGDFDVSNAGVFNTVEYLIVAGGGGGFGDADDQAKGGGGGAGGLLTGQTTVIAQPYLANIGGGGVGGAGNFPNPVNTVRGTSGSNTSIFGFVSVGGGTARSDQDTGPAPGTSTTGFGGSGGGAALSILSGGQSPSLGGVGISGQGFPGGLISGSPSVGTSAGGGGAGQAGRNGGSPGPAAGGNGLPISWVPVSYGAGGPAPGRWFAGGGAGSVPQYGGAKGGFGGGGSSAGPEGYLAPPFNVGQSGNVNTGGGGGGGKYQPGGPTNPHGGPGGSGIIIIRYIKP